MNANSLFFNRTRRDAAGSFPRRWIQDAIIEASSSTHLTATVPQAGTVQAIMPSLAFCHLHSRPRVSNDNPHAESLFRTAKYYPTLPPECSADL